ncbi:hypothetical protein [Actinokineospora globicatena]|uniref:Fibronectin type-III domain-containing protein n=1 Tax=Actinokineospora globicatena TaxID=103729 RepID=A0A9W6QJX5_9PSEU|nr:hypothetical protein [Actinokineospora globicatena]GLW89874.1 hypothetical protein Aglo03_06900 [Actinokineospora globicatena]
MRKTFTGKAFVVLAAALVAAVAPPVSAQADTAVESTGWAPNLKGSTCSYWDETPRVEWQIPKGAPADLRVRILAKGSNATVRDELASEKWLTGQLRKGNTYLVYLYDAEYETERAEVEFKILPFMCSETIHVQGPRDSAWPGSGQADPPKENTGWAPNLAGSTCSYWDATPRVEWEIPAGAPADLRVRILDKATRDTVRDELAKEKWLTDRLRKGDTYLVYLYDAKYETKQAEVFFKILPFVCNEVVTTQGPRGSRWPSE